MIRNMNRIKVIYKMYSFPMFVISWKSLRILDNEMEDKTKTKALSAFNEVTQEMQDKLHTLLEEAMRKEQLWSDALSVELPKKWEKHGDLVLFSPTTLCSDIWRSAGDTTWNVICSALKVRKVARRAGPIHRNCFRTPRVELLYGDDTWITKRENGIIYSWDVTKSMFSSGNISEKQRLMKLDCRGQTIVDLYAGIGYFTLSYLIHAKADLVYAIEWNPDAIYSLQYNLRQNKVEDKCIVLPGNNMEVCPFDVADHVNLGLIPSSEDSWPIACKALSRCRGGVLHIHGNVDLKKNETNLTLPIGTLLPDCLIGARVPWSLWVLQAAEKISKIFQTIYDKEKWTIQVLFVHKVKSYGPHIDHLVLDLQCNPNPPLSTL